MATLWNKLFQFGKKPTLPPQNDLSIPSLYAGRPNPLNNFFYNSDQSYVNNPENCSRMLADMSIYSALIERKLATAELPFSIVPEDENEPEQCQAADTIHKLINRTPDLTQLLLNLLDAMWWGKSAVVLDFMFDWNDGQEQMIVKGWKPINGTSLLFGENDRVGYKLGSFLGPVSETVFATVEGRGVEIVGEQRECWIIHNNEKTAGEYHETRSAGNIFGVGLRDRLYATWYQKKELEQNISECAQKFGSGFMTAYFERGQPASERAVVEAMQKQQGSCTIVFPRDIGGQAAEGIEVHSPPNGIAGMLEMIKYYDTQITVAIKGEVATSQAVSTGLGSNLASVHQDTLDKRIRFDATCLQETLTRQFVSVLAKHNGFEHLQNKLRWEFSLGLGDTIEKLQIAKLLHDMGIKFSTQELLKEAGFTAPLETEESTMPTIEAAPEIVPDEKPAPKLIKQRKPRAKGKK